MSRQEQYIRWNFNPITGRGRERKRYASENYGNYKKTNPNARANWGGDVNDEKLNTTIERIRWKGVRRIANYKFEGTIPEPKDVSYYQNHTGIDKYQ